MQQVSFAESHMTSHIEEFHARLIMYLRLHHKCYVNETYLTCHQFWYCWKDVKAGEKKIFSNFVEATIA
jgi:hypothetical protein